MTRGALLLVAASCAVPTRLAPPRDLSTAPIEDLSTLDDLADSNDLAGAPDLKSASGDLGAIATSWGSPSVTSSDATLAWNGNYATAFRVTLAADEPNAFIYYTLDGSAPTLSSLRALTPVPSFAISSTTRVRWFASTLAGDESAHDVTYGVDTQLQSHAAYITQDTSLDNRGPVVTVATNQMISATTTFRIWYQSTGCSGGTFPCAAQLVYGVDQVEQDCLFDGGAQNFAGSGNQTKSFMVTAPATPGVHEVQVAHIEDLSCAMAISDKALGRPTRTTIGILIVE